jgi:ketosteroid isomerase-like protein
LSVSTSPRLDRGEPEAARALLAEDVTQKVPGRSVLAGTHRGPEAVVAVDQRMRETTEKTLSWRPMIWLASGEHAHVVGRLEATRGGRIGTFDRAMVFRLANGRIAELRIYENDQYDFDEFFG